MTWSSMLLLAVTVERVGELWFARRNTKALLSKGGREIGKEHYSLIVALHTLWLSSLWVWAWNVRVHPIGLGVFVCLQALRFWTLATLGKRWTTRIIVVPGETLVAAGPYRFIRHPNYLVVIGEIAVLPLCLGQPLHALVFSIANALVLTVRIKTENAALSGSRHV
ncbi:isoprenylcysteine carboxylmethyltransferase family protein [Rhizobium sp. 2MFCol3.1]|uniref:isoprenylcysteine carboxyl methyltransferase family protein n=1 Tax=Rhizobium sp. 2MFCol3.1 TaxID=1246459 RepID=UPI00036CC961|nr:isoprenylcysteine carboxylmethyltransferase family protein [Rhizobium sp. 2MFCol3.1]